MADLDPITPAHEPPVSGTAGQTRARSSGPAPRARSSHVTVLLVGLHPSSIDQVFRWSVFV
jgi:hypothetical protein